MLKLLALLSAANLINPIDAQQVLVQQALPQTFPAQTFTQTLPVANAPFQNAFAGSTAASLQTFPQTLNFQQPSIFLPATSFGVSSLSPQAVQQMVTVARTYVTPAVENMHEIWHNGNGQGATRGPGSGSAFIVMHRAMLERMKRLGGPGFQIPMLIPGEQIPAGLSAPGVASTVSAIPAYLTTTGGFLPGTNTFVSLNTIPTLDLLGRFLSRTHRQIHTDLGGVMAEIVRSITIPLFWPVHETIDTIVDQWLLTEAGQSWASQNPNHELFTLNLDPSTYTNAYFASQNNGCGAFDPNPVCATLLSWDQEAAASAAAQTTTMVFSSIPAVQTVQTVQPAFQGSGVRMGKGFAPAGFGPRGVLRPGPVGPGRGRPRG